MMGNQDDKVVSMFREKEGATSEVNSLHDKHDIIELLKDIKTILNEQRKIEKEVGTMSDYIKREEYENYKNHLDTKFDRLFDKLDDNRKEIKKDIENTKNEIKTEINEYKNRTLTIYGIAVALIGVIVPIVLHFIS
ncbi:hypothetical protein NGF50_04050 [Mammaliicoccus sciuri]|uniref:hypothetical protein n=1 Tax=Mammaliicoccus sciuri TaxID=1296 RepID=UPI002DB88FB4|nr:hypothetical protein [Mammaliicoccus sciuri]MEB7436565.1 hypothetical protein [Mammaliicoccus sciuri]MEB8294532.1 hypothetical protein [Mammaliicoccus sciuri]